MSETASQDAAQRKRKRSIQPDDSQDARASNRSSQDVGGVYIDMPQPSSSAMAAYHAAQHPPSSQLDSQFSPPGSIFDESQPQQHEPSSASEYVPSTQAPDQSSSSSSAPVPSADVEAAALRPLPSISTRVFEPYLDDTTGMDLEHAEHRRERQLENSSPVESFSPSEQQQQQPQDAIRPEDIPRIGSWILPPLTAENSNPTAPDYTSQEVLSQIPLAIDYGEPIDPQDVLRELVASQSSPLSARRRREQRRASASPVAAPPIQSTPALAANATDVQRQESQLEPIPSQQQEAPSSTPALPPPAPATAAAADAGEDAAPTATAATSSASDSSSSSAGWSTLPRPEIIELVRRSPHIPAFLKDEIERFVLRAHRSCSAPPKSQSCAQRGSPRRRVLSQSQSQSQSQNDDSETQEDGLLRTKKLWCMDLLVFPASSPTAVVMEGITSQVVVRLTQQTQQSQVSADSFGPKAVAVILLLDTVEATFDVHELDESLARVLRHDRRYSVAFDADGRRWDTASNHSPSSAPGDATDFEGALAHIASLQTRLDTLARENDALRTVNQTLHKELADTQAQHDFVRTLYDRASASASTAQADATAARARIALLESQLAHGLALHSSMLSAAVERWKSRVRKLEAEKTFVEKQRALTDGGEVRRKAALWDQLQAEQEAAERQRVERIRAYDDKQRLRNAGLGPFAPATVDAEDELAALVREAREAGDALPVIVDDPAEGGGRARRSRRSATTAAPLASAAEMAAHVEAATLSSANARHDSRLDVEDQLALFTPSAAQADLDAAPSTALVDIAGKLFSAEGAMSFQPLEHSVREAEAGQADAWAGMGGGSVELPPSYTSESLLLFEASGEASRRAATQGESAESVADSSFQPHTQA
ncbi:conserved hypothetical protein [Sporisorium reilianum SRZ2]|uniref:Uncharacterized protein n=1 Tax=Sporisorium reilianum (strain SRZ2) TaxID=999809 RepID=E7A1Z5_SPORE|nr:conserved hypothetical protein [Sporisorium reilianum SRZ2]